MTAVWIVLIVVLASVLLYLFLAHPRWKKRPITCLEGFDFAHRGLWNDKLPENSLPAFQNAVDQGFGMEMDVHLTADDHLVVFHDDTLTRMCGVDRRIEDCTLAELQGYRLKGSAYTIPTFDEFLSLVGGQSPLIIEIKPDKRIDALCAKVYERLRHYDGVYCIESFHPLAVRWFRKHAPEVIRGQLAFGLQGKAKKTMLERGLSSLVQNVCGRPDFIAYEAATDHNLPMAYMRFCRPHLVAWTVRSQQDMNRLRDRYDLQIFERFVPKR